MRIFKNIEGIEVFKYGLISPVLHGSERFQNEYFRQLSAEGIAIPPGSDRIYHLHPSTFKYWLKRYRLHGLDGLKPKGRSDKGKYRKLPSHLFSAIEKIKKEIGAVSVSDLHRKLLIGGHITPSDVSYETLRKLVNRHKLLADKKKIRPRKKFEKEFINELWMVDFKEGKSVRHGKGMRRTYFCGIIDDASRLLVGYEWGFYQDTALFARTFKKAISVYGIPEILYSDQAKVFRSHYIMQICGRLGVSLVNAEPYSPESKAKIERFNRSVGQMFYPLVGDFRAIDVEQLNRHFDHFIRNIYHPKPHGGIGESPLGKFQRLLSKTSIRRMSQQQLEQFFFCSIKRKVRLDGTIVIKNTYYEVDMKYAGEMVEVRFPIDNPIRFFLFDKQHEQLVGPLKAVDLVANANPPHISTSYSRLWQKEEK